MKVFGVLIALSGFCFGAEIPTTSFGLGAKLPAGCAWEDNTCQELTQDTIIPQSSTGKALCCTKGLYKDEEEVSERSSGSCYWVGTAPFCVKSWCNNKNEHIVTSNDHGDGHKCWSGKKYKCCPIQKEFSITSPYEEQGNTDAKLSENVNVKYFNKLNRNLGEKWKNGGQSINFDGNKLILQDRNKFIPNIETIIMSHGFLSNAEGPHGCETFVQTYNEAGRDVQVICIDWRKLALIPSQGAGGVISWAEKGPYDGEAMNCIDVGWWMGRLLHSLVEETGLNPDKIHLIGHSLGAHVVGTMGRTFTAISSGKKVARITGLDPAGPLFVRNKHELHKHEINKNDGEFVDIIHTNGDVNPYAFDKDHPLSADNWHMGDLNELGHVDFYPNGGRDQTAAGCSVGHCAIDLLLRHPDMQECAPFFCSHGRSIEFYLKTIKAGSAGFSAYPCASAATCAKGQKTSKTVANHMGEFAKKPENGAQKNYYLDIPKNF